MTTAIPDNAATSGILVYRASRLEALLAPLETLLQTAPPASVLAPQTVIAAHPGMKHWLVSALAQRRAPHGIVANLRILLPSDWLDELAQSLLGAGAIALSPYRSAHLRWRIFEALPGIDDADLANYLQGADSARRRFQLSDRLARLYTQYMVYRPDWLKAWQSGRSAGPASFQASLWRALRLQIGLPHRAERLNELVSHLQQNAAVASSEPLHVFGLSHLAPVELHVLRAMARDRLVVLYVPDPCREYWGGLRGERAQLRALAQQAVDGELQQNLLQLDHPLLANWGRMGQHFVLALNEGEDEVRVDTRHWEDLQTGKAAQPLLAQVQESVRRLHDASVLTAASMLHAQASQDRSLRIHACHTPLRELEVLRDALLMELQQRPDLHPADIVVMAPDIQRYLGLLSAVFGAPGARDALLPYATADAAVARSHPVFVAFLSLLSLPGARITAPEIVDLLQVPAIARALGLEAEGRQQLIAWMQQSRVAWGLDGAFRQQFGVPSIQEHTFSWALDRMIAGHVFGDGERSTGFDEVWPLAGIHGAEVESIGALDRLLLELSALHRDCGQPRPASAWVRRLSHLIDALFESRHGDDAEREAIAALRRVVLSIETETLAADVDLLLDFSVVRDVLRATLAAAPDRQRLLRGGITFCGMVPQRSIPFRVIAVLGLNEGDYPRQAPDAQLDLMQRQRRLGDRDVRDDDRYLFLETLMAARDLLHLSYIGEGVRDGRARNPAAPLAELLHFLDRSAGIADAPSVEAVERPWRVRHPLQPFDARYFDGADPRLFSFRSEFAAMISGAAAPLADTGVAPAPLVQEAPGTKTLRVEQLLAFYRDPARVLCQQQLQLRLDALEDGRLMASESLEARTGAIDRIGRRLFFDAFDTSTAVPRTAPDWLRLSGLLPAGRLGVLAYAKELDAAQTLLQTAHADASLTPPPSLLPVQIDLALGDRQIRGRLLHVRAHPTQWYVLDAFVGKALPDIGFRERLPLFIEWALLRLHSRDQERSIRIVVLTEPVAVKSAPAPDDWPRALNDIDDIVAEARRSGDSATLANIHGDIEARLQWLLQLRDHAGSGWLRYFPRTSWAAAQGGLDEVADKTVKAWCGDDGGFGGERDYAPGYAGWLLRDLDLRTDAQALGEVHALAQALFALINMDAWEPVP